MALAIADAGAAPSQNSFAGLSWRGFDVTLDTSYKTGGYLLLPVQIGMSSYSVLLPSSNSGYVVQWIPSTNKLKVFYGNTNDHTHVENTAAGYTQNAVTGSAVSGANRFGPLVEVAAGTDLSAVKIRCFVIGQLQTLNASEKVKVVPATGTQRSANTWDSGSNYDRYSHIIVPSAQASLGGQLPGKSLMYASWEVDTVFSFVPYATAATNGWIALKGGNPITAAGFPTSALADIGNPAYQQAWLTAVIAAAKTAGVTGIFMDNILGDLHAYNNANYPDAYPNQAAWEEVMVTWLSVVGPALKKAGLYVAANTYKFITADPTSDNGTMQKLWFARVGPCVSAIFVEYWLQNRNNLPVLMTDSQATFNDHWDGWIGCMDVAQQYCDFIGFHRSTSADTNIMAWGRANFLLKWNGRGGAAMYKTTAGTEDPWHPIWTADPGLPAGDMFKVGVGYQRNYSNGVVLVNPNTSTPQTFPLGANYVDSTGAVVNSVVLTASTGAILTKA